uniref:Tektin n=1 Tax=Oryzias sinensis TaxID=183150 RepID=A0A8C7YQD8_9TELE
MDRTLQSHEGLSPVNVAGTLHQSERFRAECKELIKETKQICKRMQEDENQQFDQKLRRIQFLKKELELKLDEVNLEIDDLVVLQSRVTKALDACKEPLEVTDLCMKERLKRPNSERFHDEVDGELLKESEGLKRVESLLQRVTEQISEQLRLNRSAKYGLEKDLKEKSEAQNVDNICTLMATLSMSHLHRPKTHSTPEPSSVLTLDQWENISYANMAKAEQQKTNSRSLQVLVQSVLEQTAADMQKQVQATTTAIQLNVQKMKNAKNQMEDELVKIQSEISSQRKTREDLQVAVAENEEFLSLTQARLALRHERPGKEQWRDPAQRKLLADVQKITEHIKQLQQEVDRSEDEERRLLNWKLRLQESIDSKANCLYIDEVVCMQRREAVIIQNF